MKTSNARADFLCQSVAVRMPRTLSGLCYSIFTQGFSPFPFFKYIYFNKTQPYIRYMLYPLDSVVAKGNQTIALGRGAFLSTKVNLFSFNISVIPKVN